MRQIALLAAVVAVVLVGCKSRESQVVGTWSGGGLNFTFKEDKTFTSTVAGANMAGNWRFEKDKVLATTKTINGEPAEAFVKKIQEQIKANPMFAQFASKMGDISQQISKPAELTLSQDAKTLSAKNPLDGKEISLNKSES